MIKKIAVMTFAATLLMAPAAFAATANPFADVPKGHWAYASLAKLEQGSILAADKDFDGNKIITRYEMAQMVAKAMTKSLNADQKASVDKLSREFATELNTMGVKIDGIQNLNAVAAALQKLAHLTDQAALGISNHE